MQCNSDTLLLAAGAGLVGALWCASSSRRPLFLGGTAATECSAYRAEPIAADDAISARAANTVAEDPFTDLWGFHSEGAEAQFANVRSLDAHSDKVRQARIAVRPKIQETPTRSNKTGVPFMRMGVELQKQRRKMTDARNATGGFNQPDLESDTDSEDEEQ